MADITGELQVSRIQNDNEITYRYTWKGGDVIGISLAFLRDACEIHEVGDWLVIGPFTVRPIGVGQPLCLVCERVK